MSDHPRDNSGSSDQTESQGRWILVMTFGETVDILGRISEVRNREEHGDHVTERFTMKRLVIEADDGKQQAVLSLTSRLPGEQIAHMFSRKTGIRVTSCQHMKPRT